MVVLMVGPLRLSWWAVVDSEASSAVCVCEAQDQLSPHCVCVGVSARGLTSPVCHFLLVAAS